jgi:hypothetical protein
LQWLLCYDAFEDSWALCPSFLGVYRILIAARKLMKIVAGSAAATSSSAYERRDFRRTAHSGGAFAAISASARRINNSKSFHRRFGQ